MICPLCREDVEALQPPQDCPECRGNLLLAQARATDRLAAVFDRLTAAIDRWAATSDRVVEVQREMVQVQREMVDVSKKQLAALNRNHH